MTQTVQDTNAEHFSRYAFHGRELVDHGLSGMGQMPQE